MVGLCSRPMGSRIVTPSPCFLSSASTWSASAFLVLLYPSTCATSLPTNQGSSLITTGVSFQRQFYRTAWKLSTITPKCNFYLSSARRFFLLSNIFEYIFRISYIFDITQYSSIFDNTIFEYNNFVFVSHSSIKCTRIYIKYAVLRARARGRFSAWNNSTKIQLHCKNSTENTER